MAGCLSLVVDVWDPSRGGLESYADTLARGLADLGIPVEVVCGRVARGAAPPVSTRELGVDELGFYAAIDREAAAGALGTPLSFRHPGPIGGVFLPLGGLFVDALAARRAADPAWLRPMRSLARSASLRTRGLLARERAFFHDAGPADLVLTASERTAEAVRRHFPAFRGRVEVTGLPVDGELFVPPSEAVRKAARARLELPETAGVLLWLGHDPHRKGRDTAVAALRLLRAEGRDVNLVLAGGGCAPGSPSGEGIVSCGPRPDVAELLHAADVLVHPTFDDNLALAVLEALATGVPVVTTQHDGASSLVGSPLVGRVLDDPRDGAALAAACAELLEAGHDIAARAARRAAVETCFLPRHLERVRALLAPLVSGDHE